MGNNIRQRNPNPQKSKSWQWWIEKVIVPILLAMIPGYFLLLSTGAIDNPFKSQPTPVETPTATLTETSTNIPTITLITTVPVEASVTSTTVVVSVTPTEVTLSPAIQVMDQYYKYINNANIPDDFSRAWDLLTQKLKCNSSDQCKFENYRDFWLGQQVNYKLYDCGANEVDTELIYYKRGTQPDINKAPVFLRYTLVEENGQLKLNAGDFTNGISAYCPLAVSYP